MSRRRTTHVRLATRGSDLARRQAGAVAEALEDRRHEVELVEVETTGDRLQDALISQLGKTGAFVRSLDELVLDEEVEGAVHSMKDMPTESPDELVVAAIPERASANDVLVTPDGRSLDDLPEGAVVGTSSHRRGAQLRHARPDLQVEPLRGNVDTRVEKLLAPALQREHEARVEADESDVDEKREGDAGDDGKSTEQPAANDERTAEEWFEDLNELQRLALGRDVETEYDAIVLAEAGLERSGLAHQVDYQVLPAESFVPAPGQGALAVTSLDTDVAQSMHDAIDHPRTRVETTVERTVLAELGGGCIAPIGVHALVQGEHVHVTAQVLGPEGEEVVGTTRDLPIERYVDEARELAAALADRGARDLVEAAAE